METPIYQVHYQAQEVSVVMVRWPDLPKHLLVGRGLVNEQIVERIKQDVSYSSPIVLFPTVRVNLAVLLVQIPIVNMIVMLVADVLL